MTPAVLVMSTLSPVCITACASRRGSVGAQPTAAGRRELTGWTPEIALENAAKKKDD
jgi:hypothetical protein